MIRDRGGLILTAFDPTAFRQTIPDMPSLSDPSPLALAALALFLGGVLKGATGAGSPIVAVPILSLLYSVPFAVSVFVLPNLLSNLFQSWKYAIIINWHK